MPEKAENITEKPESPVVDNPPTNDQPQFEEEKVLYTWKAPARTFRKRDKEFWVRLITVASVFGLILFVIEGPMPVLLVVALVFLYYILSTVEPEDVEYQITTHGVRVADSLTSWDTTNRFWFSKRGESEVLVVELFVLPGRIEIVIPPDLKAKLTEIVKKYVPYEAATPSNYDKMSDWVAGKLEKRS